MSDKRAISPEERSSILPLLALLLSLLFRLLPERFHLVERRPVKGAPLPRKLALDVLKAATKFSVGQFQRGLRFRLEVARDVGDGEQQIAQLFAHARLPLLGPVRFFSRRLALAYRLA